jgi:hypothetical protein
VSVDDSENVCKAVLENGADLWLLGMRRSPIDLVSQYPKSQPILPPAACATVLRARQPFLRLDVGCWTLDVGCSLRSLALAACLFSRTATTRAEDPIPQAFPQGRYENLRGHSPFSLATVQAPVAPAGPGFADNWYVSGIARIGDDDFVTIKSRDLAKQFSLFASETDRDTGVSVASVNWSDAVGKSTVILRKGTETAKLEFNEAEVHATPAAAAVKPPPGGMPAGNLPNAARPMTPPVGMQVPMPALPNGNGPGAPGTPPVHHRAQVIQPPQ